MFRLKWRVKKLGTVLDMYTELQRDDEPHDQIASQDDDGWERIYEYAKMISENDDYRRYNHGNDILDDED